MMGDSAMFSLLWGGAMEGATSLSTLLLVVVESYTTVPSPSSTCMPTPLLNDTALLAGCSERESKASRSP